MAERFGWTLDYIDSLSPGDIVDYLQVQDGLDRARNSVNVKGKGKGKK